MTEAFDANRYNTAVCESIGLRAGINTPACRKLLTPTVVMFPSKELKHLRAGIALTRTEALGVNSEEVSV